MSVALTPVDLARMRQRMKEYPLMAQMDLELLMRAVEQLWRHPMLALDTETGHVTILPDGTRAAVR